MIIKPALTLSAFVASSVISQAHAQAANSGGGFDFMGLLPLVFIFGIMYFVLIRPQQKKAKQHREMLNQINRGDRVVTNGGLIGEVHQVVDESEIHLEIADGVRVRVARSMISQLMEKTQPLSVVSGSKVSASSSSKGKKTSMAGDRKTGTAARKKTATTTRKKSS
ncbi:MAG: preprotein translocase subunit YajC [bacterium]|nr:preprotein translocase subunit YajC [bacterium]